MGSLNTKKLLKQCQRMQKKQDAAKEPEPQPQPVEVSPNIEKESPVMNAVELERYLSEFLQFMRDSNRRYDAAVAAEELPNLATQDILHAIEFAPSTVDFESIIPTLHQLRQDRRTTKKELEVTTRVKDWYNANEKCLNQLMNVLGDVRKIIDRQQIDSYCWKTNVVGEKGQWLVPDSVETESQESQMEGQLTLSESNI